MNRFTKLDENGTPMPDNASTWVAVLDNTTGLAWAAKHLADGVIDWKGAKEACAAFSLCGQSDWRLPTVEELFALAHRSRFSPAIDTAFFPTTKADWYWSSTPVASAPADYAWDVSFSYGSADSYHQHYTAFVRPVRVARASQ